MPLQYTTTPDLSQDNLLEGIVNADGVSLTPAGVLLTSFLDRVDFNPVLDHEAIEEAIESEEGFAVFNPAANQWVECDEDDEDAEPVVFYTAPAEALAEVVDVDDLIGMFEHYVRDELVEATAGDRVYKAVGLSLLGETPTDDDEGENVEEKGGFKRGSFVKLRKRDPQLVNRMLGAMIAKGDIHKADAGNKSRYVAPNAKKKSATYTKNYTPAASQDPHTVGGIAAEPEELSLSQRNQTKYGSYVKKHAAKLAAFSRRTTAKTKSAMKSSIAGYLDPAKTKGAASDKPAGKPGMASMASAARKAGKKVKPGKAVLPSVKATTKKTAAAKPAVSKGKVAAAVAKRAPKKMKMKEDAYDTEVEIGTEVEDAGILGESVETTRRMIDRFVK